MYIKEVQQTLKPRGQAWRLNEKRYTATWPRKTLSHSHFSKIRSLFHFCRRTNVCFRGQTPEPWLQSKPRRLAGTFYRSFAVKFAGVTCRKKMVASCYRFIHEPLQCDWTHSRFQIWIILMPRAQSHLPFNVLFNVNSVSMDETQTLVR